MKYAFYTLGCKVNQYETQAMQQLLLARGDTLGEFDGVCDCYIVNTCTVTAVSDKKSRNAIRRARKLNPNAVIGVCGCYAQTAPEEIRKLDVDVLIGTDGRAEFLDKLAAAAAEKLSIDILLMDPPRSGSTPEFLSAAVKMAPRRIVYISCCPETQARDLALLQKGGTSIWAALLYFGIVLLLSSLVINLAGPGFFQYAMAMAGY